MMKLKTFGGLQWYFHARKCSVALVLFCCLVFVGISSAGTGWAGTGWAVAQGTPEPAVNGGVSGPLENGELGNGAVENSEPAATGLFSIIFSGGPAGIAVMVVLIALSLTAVYLVIDQILTLRRSELLPAGLGEEVRQALKENRLEAASQACQERPSMLSFVLLHGIEELPFGWSSVEKSVEEALAEQSAQLYRRAEYLSVIGNIAPMVGLLGTVMGMIMAFHRVAESQGTASASDLAEGIYQALITTVGGLVIAIPSLGAFAIFRNRLDQIIAEAAYMAQHVFSPLRKRKSSSGK